jgi:hypothetical protein
VSGELFASDLDPLGFVVDELDHALFGEEFEA